jgi:hypothetical protein
MDKEIHELAVLVREEANRVTRRANVLRKLSARLLEALDETADENIDSPKEDTQIDRIIPHNED